MSLREVQVRKIMNSHKMFEGKLKVLKTDLETQNTYFSQLS